MYTSVCWPPSRRNYIQTEQGAVDGDGVGGGVPAVPEQEQGAEAVRHPSLTPAAAASSDVVATAGGDVGGDGRRKAGGGQHGEQLQEQDPDGLCGGSKDPPCSIPNSKVGIDPARVEY